MGLAGGVLAVGVLVTPGGGRVGAGDVDCDLPAWQPDFCLNAEVCVADDHHLTPTVIVGVIQQLG